ncbi:MAG: bifunctional metallophosphatase/5'-nucleotidase [Tissierellia bacterium]|nr:bifunctional metallophosphatase/5'-nucleotidase [Tissierellia bacterium]
MNLKRLTLLHNNDIHGDFFAKEEDNRLFGGLSLLSGYVQKVRREEKRVVYAIAGDMLQGSIIDQEYQGISTIDIMNVMGPDIVTIGNHELDYGLAHLMFLERCAHFPIVNSNLYIIPTGNRLFKGYKILMVGGIRILFIGVITEEVLSYGAKDPLIGGFVDLVETAREIEFIINNYRDLDIDLTVILSHIGFEEDKKLAELLDPRLGVDLILGGHSHTMLEEPAQVNGILIAQVGEGSSHIGRFDLDIDMDSNSIHDYSWKTIPIDAQHCPRDPVMDEVLGHYFDKVNLKYGRMITRLRRPLDHSSRFRETELGNFFADIYRQQLDLDIFFVASGSIRTKSMEELVSLASLREVFPFNDGLWALRVLGSELENMLKDYFKGLYQARSREFYQFSRGLSVKVKGQGEELEILFNGSRLEEDRLYSLGMQSYHLGILETTFNIDPKGPRLHGSPRSLSTSSFDILEEYLDHHHFLDSQVEGRIILEVALE